MESFGLFNFLKSMLNFSAQTPAAPMSDVPVSEPPAEPQNAVQPPAEGENETADAPFAYGAQEAVVRFMEAHEARAKRMRKK